MDVIYGGEAVRSCAASAGLTLAMVVAIGVVLAFVLFQVRWDRGAPDGRLVRRIRGIGTLLLAALLAGAYTFAMATPRFHRIGLDGDALVYEGCRGFGPKRVRAPTSDLADITYRGVWGGKPSTFRHILALRTRSETLPDLPLPVEAGDATLALLARFVPQPEIDRYRASIEERRRAAAER